MCHTTVTSYMKPERGVGFLAALSDGSVPEAGKVTFRHTHPARLANSFSFHRKSDATFNEPKIAQQMEILFAVGSGWRYMNLWARKVASVHMPFTFKGRQKRKM